ncbi:MAG TPA: hypothetical protein VGL09_06840 [Methylomirabilota bacterium]|jgi:hypothetical protein
MFRIRTAKADGFFRRWYVAEAHRVLAQLEGTRVRTVARAVEG